LTLFDGGAENTPAGPSGPLVRVRLLVAYDGSGYRGFAAQPGVKTVGGALATALEKVLGHAVELTCAGRTDAGVHAWGQVVHFDTSRTDVDLESLQRSLVRMLRPAIVVRAAALAAPGFDARHSATGRAYRYTVLSRPWPDPFLASTAWHVDGELDLRAMQLGCDPLIGRHDFSAFCRRPPGQGADDPITRVVRDARWLDLGDGVLRFDIEASAFCHQMVRSIVGLLVAVGAGRRVAGDVAWILRSRDRANTVGPAPPTGLCLWEVSYE
jgi:tRNA pseudouridine38-40 synthase